MNESGLAVRGLAKRFGIDDPASIVVVHDELDLPPGTVRVKSGGGLAGHNGLRSLQSHLHTTDFVRVRIGVGKPPSARQGAEHVLNRPPKAVRALLEGAVETAADTVERIAGDGVEAAMQWCHSLPDGRCDGRAGSVDRVTSASRPTRCPSLGSRPPLTGRTTAPWAPSPDCSAAIPVAADPPRVGGRHAGGRHPGPGRR